MYGHFCICCSGCGVMSKLTSHDGIIVPQYAAMLTPKVSVWMCITCQFGQWFNDGCQAFDIKAMCKSGMFKRPVKWHSFITSKTLTGEQSMKVGTEQQSLKLPGHHHDGYSGKCRTAHHWFKDIHKVNCPVVPGNGRWSVVLGDQ